MPAVEHADAVRANQCTAIALAGVEDLLFEHGTLVEVNPYYTHSYGKFVPELIQIDRQLREILFGGEE